MTAAQLRRLTDDELEAHRVATHRAMVTVSARSGFRAAEHARRHLDLIHAEQKRRETS